MLIAAQEGLRFRTGATVGRTVMAAAIFAVIDVVMVYLLFRRNVKTYFKKESIAAELF
jgi:hypothetical protein